MSGDERNARKVMKVTGALYEPSMDEVRRRIRLGELRAYMMSVTSIPVWEPGKPIRCVRCLAPEHGKCEY